MKLNLNSDFGRELLGAAQEETTSHLEALVEYLTVKEIRQILEVLKTIVNVLEAELKDRMA